uniref:Uncharacterized protein n=1 Tax=Oryzias latipes TaxID=8090 RepID=A0A3B3H4P7_ORYLA
KKMYPITDPVPSRARMCENLHKSTPNSASFVTKHSLLCLRLCLYVLFYTCFHVLLFFLCLNVSCCVHLL